MSLLNDAAYVESSRVLSRFRNDVYACLKSRADALFELADALLCEPGPVHSPVDLTLSPEYRRGRFRNLRPALAQPARAPKPSRPGPGRPPGIPNRRPAPRYDVGKTVKRGRTLAALQQSGG
ncbi:hypothetical protein [Nonomuraea sp. LPB2021202275-12-8]|uniref:hypothetical protein n=1 Tax=Nonomuraea sp. LPB2021202275-12-8 TaxID=3120159 RepID=UPI00300D7FA9